MSHFTTVTTQIKSRADLIATLENLGYTIIETTRIKGYSTNVHVEFAVETPQGGYQIGFRLDKGTYEIVADWWGVKGITREKFRSDLLVEYAERKVRAFAKRKKLRVIEEKAQEGRQLQLVRRSYA